MARVVLDIPAEKMSSFIKALLSLGIDTQMIAVNRLSKSFMRKRRIANSLKKISASFILFDWEFFSNELEYE